MSEPKVAVIVPIYNKEQYLKRCVDSVLNQTFREIEIILVDDGSKDNSASIIDDYATLDSRVKVIHQKNAGVAEARRKGIQSATAPYLFVADADDELPAGAIEFMYDYSEQNNLDALFGAYKRIEEECSYKVSHPFERILTGNEVLSYVLDLRFICGPWYFSRREVWQEDVFLDKDIRYPSEDVLMNIKATRHMRRAGVVNEVVYYYYCIANSLSTTPFPQSLWKRFFEDLKVNLLDRGEYEENRKKIQILEIDRLAFYLKTIDCTDEWIKEVLQYDLTGFPLKTRILRMLLRTDRLRWFLINTNRGIKKLFNKK